MHVGGVGVQTPLLARGHMGEHVIHRSCRRIRGAEATRFLNGLLAPATGHNIVGCRPTPEQIHGDGRELAGRAALHPENAVVVRHAQQRFQVGRGLLGNGDEFLTAMAHFHHGHTGTVPVQQVIAYLLKHINRQRGRAGGEIKDARHGTPNGLAEWHCGAGGYTDQAFMSPWNMCEASRSPGRQSDRGRAKKRNLLDRSVPGARLTLVVVLSFGGDAVDTDQTVPFCQTNQFDALGIAAQLGDA